MEKSKGLYLDERFPVCACGCRKPLSIYGERNRGYFLEGHHVAYWEIPERFRQPRRTSCPLRKVNQAGYMRYRRLDPQTGRLRFVVEHRWIAERALGRPLDSRHPVHHVDGVKTNNAPSNLVICESDGYHQLLHERAGMRYFGDKKRKP